MHEFIMYRNPMEAAFWQGMNGEGLFIFLKVVLIGISFACWAILLQKLSDKYHLKKIQKNLILFSCILSTITTILFIHFHVGDLFIKLLAMIF